MNNIALSLLLMVVLPVISAMGGARRFTYVYEATTSPPGDVEIENWVTWKTSKPNDHRFDQVDFRHEIEFGITNRFQAAVYLADWNYADGASVDEPAFLYSASAIELMCNLTNPVSDWIGLTLYQEARVGPQFFESESKLIAQKNFGRFTIAYNATLEAVWEGHELEEQEGELQQSLGLSYEISPHVFVGAECLHEIAIPEWENAERPFFFAGPNVSLRSGRYWGTVTALAQLTNAGDEPDLQLRAIFGFSF
jgi:hypothetical protein